jgi:hypothetical protein
MSAATEPVSLAGLMFMDTLERADRWLERCMCEVMRAERGTMRWRHWMCWYQSLAMAFEHREWAMVDEIVNYLERVAK